MFHCYDLRSLKTGRRYVGSCEDLRTAFADTILRSRKPPSTACRGYLFEARVSQRAEKLWRENAFTRPAEEEMNWINSRRAVAAATGRRFKSCHPDHFRSMFQCYVLRSLKTGRRYVGSCEDLSDRVRRHSSAESKTTKHGVPWILIRSESFATRREALARERFYRTGRGR